MTGRPVLVLTEWPFAGIMIVLVFQSESLGFPSLSSCSSLSPSFRVYQSLNVFMSFNIFRSFSMFRSFNAFQPLNAFWSFFQPVPVFILFVTAGPLIPALGRHEPLILIDDYANGPSSNSSVVITTTRVTQARSSNQQKSSINWK